MNNGKGDAPRPVNLKVYRENFDRINWSSGNQCMGCQAKWPFTSEKKNTHKVIGGYPNELVGCTRKRYESHLDFMRSMGYRCATEAEAYRLRGLLDL